MKYGSPQGPVASFREHGNLPLGFTKAEFFFSSSWKIHVLKDYVPRGSFRVLATTTMQHLDTLITLRMTINKMVSKSYIYFIVRTLKDSKVYENFHKQHSHAK
jgi:hypothetical protein